MLMLFRGLTGPWVWRVLRWGLVVAITMAAAAGVQATIWSGVAVALAAVAIQFTGDARSMRTSTAAVIAATVLGLAAVLISSKGLGEIPAFVAASRIPFPINRGPGRIFLILDTIAVGAVIGYVSHSLIGILAGLGIPLVAERAVERRALIAARDEAQALLVEVQAGREAEAEAAALQERGRIARDLHDVLAHSLAGLSVQLQATRSVAAAQDVPASVLAPLDKAAALARDGLAEARAAVGTLRDPVGLGLAEIPALVARQPGSVALETVGTPVPIAAEPGHAVYRAVQEALTNAARYAPGADVVVTITFATDRLCVTVEDSGPPPGRAALASQGTGLGLAGMDERIRGVGGSLTAGPRPVGGWSVRVEVPT